MASFLAAVDVELMRRLETASIWIERAAAEVYDFLARPESYANWSNVLGPVFRQISPLEWIAEQPTVGVRPLVLRFTARNELGVLDHRVFRDGALVRYVPMRVIEAGDGAILTYGLFVAESATDEQVVSELEWVRADLETAKVLLELR